MTASLLDQLRSPDDHTRLRAARRAGADGDPELTDPDPRVRPAAARSRRYAEDSAAFVAAACVETDRRVRQAFVDGLTGRPLTEPVGRALIGCPTADDGYPEWRAAGRLKQADDPAVAAAIASRIPVVTDEGQEICGDALS